MAVSLRIVDEAGRPTGVSYDFDAHDTFLFGRDLKAHCRIVDDPGVSRHHFLLEVVPPRARLKDLGSTNGVRVNGVLYGGRHGLRGVDGAPAPVDLKPGDRVRVGKTTLEFVVRGATGAPRPDTATVDASSFAAGGDDDDGLGGLEEFCDRCGKMVDADSVTRVDGRTLCMACRYAAEEKAAASPAAARRPAGFADLLRAQAERDDGPPAIAGYAIDRLIGRGGMGAVYHGVREADGLEAAIKVMRPENGATAASVAQFRREISVSRRLAHENIVAFLDEGEVGGSLYLVMEYVSDGSVAARIRRNRKIPPKHALPWMRQMAAGLAAAHRLDLIHRDIKPGNMLLRGRDWRAVVKLSDFGLAKSFISAGLSQFTATGTAAGTATCMPPEQLSNFKRVTMAADVFSLGATFYEMLAGVSPYNFKPGKDPMMAVLDFDLMPLAARAPGLPSALTELVDRCLRADPDERYPDAMAVQEALAAL